MTSQHHSARPRGTSEPVAIIGIGCRFAGGATSPSKLWELLANPTDLSRPVPPERFNAASFYHPDGEHHGTTDAIKAYWLDQDYRGFDAAFFNITPQEAEALDPQQRMLLEVVYEALESSGYTLPQVAGRSVAVFSGVMTNDFDTSNRRDELSASHYSATGNSRSIIANRISYFFNFRGPSLTIDTACSSSLVALHQAVLSLRAGESEMACVAGVNLMLTPEQFVTEASLHMLSPTGHCRMWDAAADGYARGEGVATIFIKTLSKALEDGDHIQGIIRETGVNSDGRSKGLTMPNPAAQTSLITETYLRAGLDPKRPSDRCQYFEAHGTGTKAGDPAEASAINAAFFGSSDVSTPEQRLLVGSVKTVIGHTEGAAGLAGVLKVVQAMENATVPPNLHLETLSPTVSRHYANLRVPTKSLAWPVVLGQPRRASVNSFGFGGTNAHAIIEAYEPDVHDTIASQCGYSFERKSIIQRLPIPRDGDPPLSLPLLLSATSQKTLFEVMKEYRHFLEQNQDVTPDQLAWHLCSSRSAHSWRAFVPGGPRNKVLQAISSQIQRVESAGTESHGFRDYTRGRRPQILGIFTGQGAHWIGMGRELLTTNAAFLETIQKLDLELQNCPEPPRWSLASQIEDLRPGRIIAPEVLQPLCTAIQIGLVNVLKSLHVTFSCVVGHSSGEIAAAYAAGRLSARHAIIVAFHRGICSRLAEGPAGQKGGMVAVGLSEVEGLNLVETPRFRNRLCVAAVNAPQAITISGDIKSIHEAHDMMKEEGKLSRLLNVEIAYHSHHMEHAAEAYLDALRRCDISPSEDDSDSVVWVSSVYEDGDAPPSKDLRGTYWAKNLRRPVLFRHAVSTAVSRFGPFDCAVEVGPHPALARPTASTAQEADGATLLYTGTLNREMGDAAAMSNLLGFLWSRFGPSSLDIREYVLASPTPNLTAFRLADAPTYPWDHSQVNHQESRIARQFHFRKDAPHELLGIRTPDDTDFDLRWRNILRLNEVPWIEGHRFQGLPLLPASAYCIMALDATRVALNGRDAALIDLIDLEFTSGISVEADTGGVETLFTLTLDQTPTRPGHAQSELAGTFSLSSCLADGKSPMKKNFSGRLRVVLGSVDSDALPSRPTWHAETLPAEPQTFYHMMEGLGLGYSGPFCGLASIDRRYNFATTTIQRRHPEDTSTLKSISPATLDSCLQSCFSTFCSPGDTALWTLFLPKKMKRVRFNMAHWSESPENSMLAVDAHLTDFRPTSAESAASVTTDVSVYNDRGQMEIKIEGLSVASFAPARPEDDHELYLHTVMDLDPEDTIISPSHGDDMADVPRRGAMLVSAFTDRSQHLARFQDHVARIAQQIVHRYPHMNILDLTHPGLGLAKGVLETLQSSFKSYTLGRDLDAGIEEDLGLGNDRSGKITVAPLAAEHGNAASDLTKYDLVLLSTNTVGHDTSATLKHVKTMMRPGGFLMLVHAAVRSLDTEAAGDMPPTPPDWPDVLEQSGFTRTLRNADQYLAHGYTICVRQAECAAKIQLQQPQANAVETQGRWLILGGKQRSTKHIVRGLANKIKSTSGDCLVLDGLDRLDPKTVSSLSAVLFLADLDEPVISNLTPERLEVLKALMKPDALVLWVTHRAMVDEPEHAASFGLARTLLAEIPNLRLQMLDLDTLRNAAEPICDSFVRLALEMVLLRDSTEDVLWNQEPEIYIQNGRRFIARVMPFKPGNDRVNAVRRVVTEQVDTTKTPLDIVQVESPHRPVKFETRRSSLDLADEPGTDRLLLQVDYSSLYPVNLGEGFKGYICYGKDIATGEPVTAFAASNSSFLSASNARAFHWLSSSSEGLFLGLYPRVAMARRIVALSNGCRVILVEPDQQLLQYTQELFHIRGIPLRVITANADTSRQDEVQSFMHSRTSRADVMRMLREIRVVFNFLPDDHELSETIRSAAPANCRYYSQDDLLRASLEPLPSDVACSSWGGIREAINLGLNLPRAPLPPSSSVPAVLQDRNELSPWQAIDWKSEQIIERPIEPLVGTQMLSSGRTYVLVGLTRDLGQSLCRLFAEQGARHIVVASRSPTKNTKWRDELMSNGVEVRVEALDVTDIAAVKAFKNSIEKTMPPVAGVVNAAMVLEDRVWSELTAESLHRVLLPKTIGSRNLDITFNDPGMEFFIMTSSFAAVGGHAGQVSYAAANMYMNGIAASRRHRGLHGSALNIGVIYGLGFLHREKKADVYAGLERDGYPPISERDLHHMFLEAIAGGRDLTTGLRRYTPGAENELPWQQDPRFGHFTVRDTFDKTEVLDDKGETKKTVRQMVEDATTAAGVAEALMAALCAKLEGILQVPPGSVHGESSISDLGVDSLVAVEIRNWFWRALSKDVPVMKIMSPISVAKLCEELTAHIMADKNKKAVKTAV